MEFINLFGLGYVLILLVPNIVFALCRPTALQREPRLKSLETAENIGRYGCMASMVLKIPGLWLGWWSRRALGAYFIANTILSAVYLFLWLLLWRKDTLFKAVALSAVPSALFLISGVTSLNIPLMISAAVFAPTHIFISCRNAGRTSRESAEL